MNISLGATSGWYKSRDSPPVLFSGKSVLKICSKFTREHPCRSVVSIATLLKSLFAIRVFFVNLQHIFRTPL